MLKIAIACLLLTLSSEAQTTESCRVIHGRERRYCGDGQLRIWHIGTHITTSSRTNPPGRGLKDGLRLERNQLVLAKITPIFLPTF